MDTIKEVTVFTNGNSRTLSTWSNVPFFLTETLISKGIKVNRVDLTPSLLLDRLYGLTWERTIRVISRDTTYTYFRSLIHFLDARLRIKEALNKFDNSEMNIFLTFSFSSVGMTKRPTVLICDWPYEHYINYRQNRKPDLVEKRSIKRENNQIEGADLIFPLFPDVTKYMKTRYKNKNIFYLGNVINSLYGPNDSEILEKKSNSNSLLFIGGRKYIQGAQCLVDAFHVLKKDYPHLSLNIIGMNDSDVFGVPKDGINCYGYLDKGKDVDRQLYYSLLQDAKIFVNTTPKWGAFSATLEAMYFYIPVIVTPFKEFGETFGMKIGFGCYCENNSADLCAKIKKILDYPSYGTLCINAHESVKDFTWSAYIDKMLTKVKETL